MEFINKIKQNYEQWARVTPQDFTFVDRALFWLCRAIADWFSSSNFASMPYSARVFNDTFYFTKRDAVLCLTFFSNLLFNSPNFFLSMGKVARKSFLVGYCFINTGSWYRDFC